MCIYDYPPGACCAYVWLKTIEPMLKKEGMNDRRVDVVAHFCNFLFGEDATGHIYAKEKLCIISGIPQTC